MNIRRAVAFMVPFMVIIAPTIALAGVYAGIVRTINGLVVIDSPSFAIGARRVSDIGRVEVDDIIRVGDQSSAELLIYDGTRIVLDAGADYRVGREALFRQLDGGDIVAKTFRSRLGGRTQGEAPRASRSFFGIIAGKGRPFWRRAAEESWSPLQEELSVSAGDLVRCGDGSTAMFRYDDGGEIRFLPGAAAYLHEAGVHLERGGCVVALDDGSSHREIMTSMALIQARGAAVFRVVEDRGGCTVCVLEGIVVVHRKTQGYVARTTIRSGESGGLTRAGVLRDVESFIDSSTASEWAEKTRYILEAEEGKTEDPALAGFLGWETKMVSDPPPGEPAAVSLPSPEEVSPPSLPEKSGPPATEEELEELFRLPRPGETDRHRSRP